MKKLFITLVALVMCTIVNAQYYYVPYVNPTSNPGTNPGDLNNDGEYPVGGGLDPAWVTIRTPNAAPVWSANQTIPFAFSFNGNTVSQFKVSNSGILTFDVGTALAAPSFTRAALPNAAIPDNSVCIWGLAGLAGNDNVVMKTFGTAPNQQLWIGFSSYGFTAPAGSGTLYTYWGIVLEETSNKIYIVDQRTGGYTAAQKQVSAGIQINSTTAISVAGSPNLTSTAGSAPLPTDNTYFEFLPGSQPAYDMYCKAITTSAYLVIGSNNITGTIRNVGSTTITSFTLNYTIDGGAPITAAITGVSIAPNAIYTFTHSVPWVSAASGTYIAQCYATDLNGANADQNTSNDAQTKTLNVLTEIHQRIPLFEIFTSSTCPPCQPGNLNFHTIIDPLTAANHVYIKYQQDFPGTGDPYTTIESLGKRTGQYGINSIPRMENDGGWDGNANSFTLALYQAARAVPAQYKMMGTYTADTTARTFSAKVVYSPLFDAVGTHLNVAIIENTTSLNVKSNGETEFYQVMKKMLPDDGGTLLPTIPAGTWDSVTVTYTFNGNYRLPLDGQAANIIDNSIENSVEEFGDLAMVGWMQASLPSKQVYQAHNFILDTSTGMYEMSKNINSILIYPNPADEFTAVEISLNDMETMKVQLMDMNGRTLEVQDISGKSGMTTVKFNTSQLAAGAYHVAVTDSKHNSFVKRIIVSHQK